MKKQHTKIGILFLILLVYSCGTKRYGTQGEAQNAQYKKIFKKEYLPEAYSKSRDTIEVISEDKSIKIQFDTTALILNNEDSEFISLFKSGLIYPEMIGCYSNEGCMIRLEELTYLNKKSSIRRYEILIWNTILIHPEIILIELTNTSARKYLDTDIFIRNAEVTFMYNKGWIQI